MKKLTLSVALAITTFYSFAEKCGLYLSTQINFGVSKVRECNFNDYNASLIGKFYTNEHVTAGYMFTPHFGIFTGAGISSYKYTIQIHSLPANDWSDKYTYFQIPLYLRYVSSKSRGLGFSVEAGAGFDFLMKAKEKALPNGESYDIKEYLASKNIVLFCSPAIKFPVSDRISLDVGPTVSTALKNAYHAVQDLKGTFTSFGGRANLNIRLTDPKKKK